jgi:hypothetical protein
MTVAQWPPSPREVAHFRDAAGTWFAADIMRADDWDDAWQLPPHRELADIRVAFLNGGSLPPPHQRPRWLVVLRPFQEAQAATVVSAALAAWEHSPHYRGAGPSVEEYLVAGFQSLCPPHPPCDLRPNARDSLSDFLRDRPAPLGLLANMGRDAFNRAVRLHWETPQSFSEAILRERIRDDDGVDALDVTAVLATSAIALDIADFADMEYSRRSLLDRLSPERFFTHARDFDAAVALAHGWVDRYERAYRLHYRHVVEAACSVLVDIAPALAAAGELDSLNRVGRPIGETAVHRLAAAVGAIRAIPEAPAQGGGPAGDVMLGRLPQAFGEARLAAAAVLAALEVQRRRAATAPFARH